MVSVPALPSVQVRLSPFAPQSPEATMSPVNVTITVISELPMTMVIWSLLMERDGGLLLLAT